MNYASISDVFCPTPVGLVSGAGYVYAHSALWTVNGVPLSLSIMRYLRMVFQQSKLMRACMCLIVSASSVKNSDRVRKMR